MVPKIDKARFYNAVLVSALELVQKQFFHCSVTASALDNKKKTTQTRVFLSKFELVKWKTRVNESVFGYLKGECDEL